VSGKAQAKNGDELFEEEKFHVTKQRPKPALKVPCIFSFLVAGGRRILSVFPGSQSVPY
jgi:hypothetical protein